MVERTKEAVGSLSKMLNAARDERFQEIYGTPSPAMKDAIAKFIDYLFAKPQRDIIYKTNAQSAIPFLKGNTEKAFKFQFIDSKNKLAEQIYNDIMSEVEVVIEEDFTMSETSYKAFNGVVNVASALAQIKKMNVLHGKYSEFQDQLANILNRIHHSFYPSYQEISIHVATLFEDFSHRSTIESLKAIWELNKDNIDDILKAIEAEYKLEFLVEGLQGEYAVYSYDKNRQSGAKDKIVKDIFKTLDGVRAKYPDAISIIDMVDATKYHLEGFGIWSDFHPRSIFKMLNSYETLLKNIKLFPIGDDAQRRELFRVLGDDLFELFNDYQVLEPDVLFSKVVHAVNPYIDMYYEVPRRFTGGYFSSTNKLQFEGQDKSVVDEELNSLIYAYFESLNGDFCAAIPVCVELL